MTEMMFRNVRKTYGNLEVLHGIDLDITAGELIVFVGPSGCGKSTLLRLIAGLEDITSGNLTFDGKVVNELSPLQRGIAMVFQSYALYPHMTVYNNLAFGLKLAGSSRHDIDDKVRKAAKTLHLSDYLDRLPRQLSGGQRQRVAIGRAIVRNPRVFLFDEPLSNLDAALRVATRLEIAKLHERLPNATMIYVTHDQVEAMTLADRIVILNNGRVEQVGTPMELYREPANLFVAQFIGSPAMNILSCTVQDGGRIVLPAGEVIPCGNQLPPITRVGEKISLGIRPEDLEIVPQEDAVFHEVVSVVEQLGEHQLLYVGDQPIVAKVDSTLAVRKGDVVHLAAAKERIHIFGANGSALKQVHPTRQPPPSERRSQCKQSADSK